MVEASSWHGYPKVYNIGHAAVRDIFLDPVVVDEKADGSSFSFGVFPNESGELVLRCRSKGAQLNIECPEKMFKPAVETAKALADKLRIGWTYRGEFLGRPKHNVLCYSRIPKDHIIIFDVNPGYEQYLPYDARAEEAARIGLEVVPKLYEGKIDSPEQLLELLHTVSILGGQKIEGVVCKNYKRFTIDGHAMIAKYVSEAFKEVHTGDWKERNPGQNDIITRLVMEYRTPARWNKAIQHLREAGTLLNDPKDIGPLMKAVSSDVHEECANEIKEKLYKWAWPLVARQITKGLPEYYKEQLVRMAFESEVA